jgi:phosphoglycerol transferase MdoB-like AlkP superfamily enzyme
MYQSDVLFFLLRYTPWWAVPLLIMSIQFSYIYWLKDYRSISIFLGVFAFFCFIMIIVFALLGGTRINEVLLKSIS